MRLEGSAAEAAMSANLCRPLEERDEISRAIDRPFHILRTSDRSNCRMPVDREGQRSPRLLRQGRATSQQGQTLRGSKVVDILEVENSRLDAKIKNICRGC